MATSSTVNVSSSVQPLIEGYQQIDPRLYDILSRLQISVSDIQSVLFPIQERVFTPIEPEIIPPTPTGFSYYTTIRNLILTWDPTPHAQYYELRLGSNWESAQFVTRTLSYEARLDPILVGTTRYLLKAINATGIYCDSATYVDVIIPPLGSITVNGRVIDNNVLLSWSTPVSVWEVDHYTISKGNTVIGVQRGTFIAAFETVAGTFTYSVYPTDIAGNNGPPASATLTVNQPPDFELQDFRKSILPGLKVNALVYGSPIIGWVNDEFVGWDAALIAGQPWTWIADNTGKILVCVDLAENWNTHFTSKGWNTVQDQVSAGYPIYILDTLLTAKYQEVIDYGTTIPSTIFNMNYTLEQLSLTGTVSELASIEASLDRITWTPVVHGKSAFLSNFRYIRVTFDFTENNDKALALFYNLTFSLDVKREMDSGHQICFAADISGTVVTFNKQFKDIDSINVTPTKTVEPLTIIYDFVDIPNPTSFKVLVFNSTGVRVTADVSWQVRGIV